ncbi:hypothetical protein C8R45DRAFT_1016612 [Mycena sanguinolenta]|nr:hypothetical protein C8R45DRAFT_1016612 [Mycena sanguinolenta]
MQYTPHRASIWCSLQHVPRRIALIQSRSALHLFRHTSSSHPPTMPDNGDPRAEPAATAHGDRGIEGTTRATLRSVIGDRQWRVQQWASPDPREAVGAWCRRSLCAVCSHFACRFVARSLASVLHAQWTCCPRRRKAHLPRFVGPVNAQQYSAPARLRLFSTYRVVPAPDANGVCNLSECV